VKFLEGMGGEIGRERGDALEEILCSGTEIEDHRFLWQRGGGLVKARQEAHACRQDGFKQRREEAHCDACHDARTDAQAYAIVQADQIALVVEYRQNNLQ
jgi:hypothetical protein